MLPGILRCRRVRLKGKRKHSATNFNHRNPLALNDMTPEMLQEALDAVTAHGSISAAARVLGIHRKTLSDRYHRAVSESKEPEVQALIVGEKAAPGPGQMLKGVRSE